jgi:ribonuclease J
MTLEGRAIDAPAVDVIPLGGVGEFGMNMLLVACGDTALLVDAGVMFPEPELFGVDLVIPDMSALDAYRGRIARSSHARSRGSHRRRRQAVGCGRPHLRDVSPGPAQPSCRSMASILEAASWPSRRGRP